MQIIEVEILQVKVAADTVASICASRASGGNLYVVDAGGGKGYLSTHLALEYKIKVLGVDWNPDNSINAMNRSEKLGVTIHWIHFENKENINVQSLSFLSRECGIR